MRVNAASGSELMLRTIAVTVVLRYDRTAVTSLGFSRIAAGSVKVASPALFASFASSARAAVDKPNARAVSKRARHMGKPPENIRGRAGPARQTNGEVGGAHPA